MLKKILVFVMMFGLFCQVPAGFAASPWTEADSYGDKVRGKLDFGIKNFLGGWTEIFTEKMEAKENGDPCYVGLGRGIYHAVANTVGGAIHTATFFVPIDVPLPHNGVNLE